MHPSEFFEAARTEEGLRRARAVCDSCPVRQACLDCAVTNHIGFGVWGRMTPHERRKIYRRQRQPHVEAPLVKMCSTCRTERRVDQFGRNASRVDGLCANCKFCENARTAERHQRRKTKAAV
jgi:hypothetical protein